MKLKTSESGTFCIDGLLLILSHFFYTISRSVAYNYSLLGQNLSERIITVFPGSREADTSALHDKSFEQHCGLQYALPPKRTVIPIKRRKSTILSCPSHWAGTALIVESFLESIFKRVE